MAIGRHRGGNQDHGNGEDIRRSLGELPTYEPFDAGNCRHRKIAELSGRRVCNDGCGKDLGPVKVTDRP